MPDQITDPQDPRLADYVALTDVALRRRIEPEGGLYIAESEKVIRRALAAGHRPRSYLMAQRWLTDLGDVVADAEAPDEATVAEAIDVRAPWFALPPGASLVVTRQAPRRFLARAVLEMHG
ncbi:MAG TPA: hypothetical protein PLP55_05165, partial [Phycicoccus elongatus]|nr:hypothetical protein [Phycicoccus elongatus]